MRYLYIALAAGVVLGAGWYFFSSRQPSYLMVAVVRGPITQEVLASGNVESPTSADLHFKNPGQLVALNVAVGQKVAAGDVLARQDTSVLQAQLAQAKAAVATAQANLASLQEGTRPEQLAVTQAAVSSDGTALLNALTSAFTAADSAVQNDADPLFSSPHSQSPQLNFSLPDSQLALRLENDRAGTDATLAAWEAGLAGLTAASDFTAPLSQAQSALASVLALLADANGALNQALPGASASQTQLNTWAAGVAAARTSLTTAQSAVSSAAAALTKDQKTLALELAGSTASALSAQQATVAAAQANVQALAAQIQDLEIIAPFAGTVTDTNGTVGENLTPDVAVVSLIPHTALDVKVNVSEDNIVGVVPGEGARVELDAFPAGTDFAGTVSAVDPAQTVIGGAVYYQTTILFNRNYAGIKPGMTANVWIETGSSTDALLVPASALTGSGASTSVDLLRGGAPVAVPVITGLRGQNGMVQILSGLAEGQSVVVGER